ncbi:MAG: lipid hydroperoxide peroxidase [Dehalococcoidia bacterium]|nr:lipid hydroperoxide peroxidase [Dehalococcoidia bacterium]
MAVEERVDAATRDGTLITLLGRELQVGDRAPDFLLVDTDLNEVSLADTGSKVRILSLVHSVDTGVCHTETIRFDEEAAKLDDVDVLTISIDLPFALKRWAEAEDVRHHQLLSAYRNPQFGIDYGVTMKDLRLLSRTILVLDKDNVIRYAEYLPEVVAEPDYDDVLAATRQVASAG